MSDDDEFTFNPDEDDEDELAFDSESDDDEYDDDELDEEARLAEAREIARLRWEIDALKEVHTTLREHYRNEMRTLIEPLVDKHRELKEQNRQLHADLEAAIKARDDADFGIKNEIADMRAAYAALVVRSDELEVDNRLGRRLQAEMDDADAKIAKLESEIADLERDCRKLEKEVAERDREHEAIRRETAQTSAQAQEWHRRFDQALIDNADEIAMYQEQINEASEQATILEVRAQELQQVDHLLPELHASLRAEKATIDGIEALLFPRPPAPEPEPEPVLAAVGAGGGDGPPTFRSAAEPAGTLAEDSGAWDDTEVVALDDGDLEVVSLDDASPDPSAADLQPEWQAVEAGWDAPTDPDALPELAQDLSWPGEVADGGLSDDVAAWQTEMGETGNTDEAAAWQTEVPDTGMSDDMAAWQTESDAPDAVAHGWDVPPARAQDETDGMTVTAQRRHDELLAHGWGEAPAGSGDEIEDPTLTAQRRRDEMLAYGMQADDTGAELPDGTDWQMADSGSGAIGAVGIPGFDDESAPQ